MIASTFTTVVGFITVMLLLGVILASVVFASKARGLSEALDKLTDTNRAYGEALEFERAERLREQEICTEQVAVLRLKVGQMEAQIAELKAGKG